MRKSVVVAAVFAALAMRAQTRRNDLLLPQSFEIAGIVVDQQGNPIADVTVDHLDDWHARVLTGADGTFRLQTRAPALVLRRAGYGSYFFRTAAAPQPLRVTLSPGEGEVHAAQACAVRAVCIGDIRTGFCLPRIKGVKLYPPVRDVDYVEQRYVVKTRTGKAFLGHGHGLSWSDGRPLDEEVWTSVEYAEVVYAFGDRIIWDARGRTADGKRWRDLATIGESAFYHGADETCALLLDRLLDGVCFRR